MSGIDTILLDGETVDKEALREFLRIHEIPSMCNDTPLAGKDVMRYEFRRAVTLPQDLPNSSARALVPPTADTDFDIKKNGVSIGTLTFEAGSPTSTLFTFAADVNFAVGDLLQITAPDPADATLADISFSIVGHR